MTELFDFSTFPTLTTDRLVLRQLTHADADVINALFSDPQVIEVMSEPPLNSTEKAIELIDWLNGHFAKQNAARWGITLKDDGRLMGTCGFHKWNRENRHADLGYDLLPAYWGRGYGPEAARAVVAWSFANLNLHRMQADCTDGNLRSERTLLKLGFKPEGLWREQCWEHERFVDIKQFGLLRREWEASR